MKKIRIIACGGGTISHAIPTITVCQSLMAINSKIEILYVASKNGPEIEYLKNNLKYTSIYCGKIYRYLTIRLIASAILNIVGFLQAFWIVLINRPKLVFAKGGYATFAIAINAKLFGIPVVIHESDSIIGLSNSIAAKFAKIILTGFPAENYEKKYHNKIVFSGIPLRNEFKSPSLPRGVNVHFSPSLKTILILGGSQGAEALTSWVAKNILRFLDDTQIIHVCGSANYEKFKYLTHDKNIVEARNKYILLPFVRNGLAYIMKNSTLIVSRAGATSIAELSYLSKPAVLVPYPFASKNHQQKNGEILVKNKACILISQSDLDEKTAEILKLLNDSDKLKDLGKNISSIMPKDSLDRIANVINDAIINN
ncbi:MAG: UDP-N-acetylglucosamine--N-acetylmuramyl-(pentapeptide) pyrophosphoryl-undecaprenol N-acetylglucosamine transferase [Candidatus Berkelbacteria bacterium Licking1014_85]|uniref:UDP-N-acetylglucosamine--N-acetylmuramyl-(pentapeptide) pyrophosphoryl-undecaprenol N-acetylglucosamine transferase n=1 Tax=Candidatus Berkelbacteria bacterium Licking1014_85 TaxID=2017148 RepID=A0A554LHM7_9BACT|nr:MAG: UDP-N-acetylglucosamine--N-acetylmuramyl-(pentapeptide) pyrophosphoryl-undecaprenol N-acetylglucosamine transferase [Candidatus Berkelbacteria bacterium Licking1014_85]